MYNCWGALVLLLCLVGSTTCEPDAYYRVQARDDRKCSFPYCGGYYLDKVNVREKELSYVSWIDLSELGEDIISTVNNYVNQFGYDLIVYKGNFIPFKPPAEPPLDDVNTLNVTAVYLGLPGVNATRAVLRKGFYTVDSLGESPALVALNDDRPPTPLDTNASQFIVEPAPYLDRDWQLLQIMKYGAIITVKPRKHRRLSSFDLFNTSTIVRTLSVFVKLPVQVGPCPMVMEVYCNETLGQQRIYSRNPSLCFLSQCTDPPPDSEGLIACAQAFPVCDPGYRLACWTSSRGDCMTFKCDPTFAPIASKGACGAP